MNESESPSRVERLFPFVLRSRALLIGRETLLRSKRKLHFVLITTDLAENSKREVLRDFSNYPIVQLYTSEDLKRLFRVENAKVVGFQKSGLAKSIYAEMKGALVQAPKVTPDTRPPKKPVPPAAR